MKLSTEFVRLPLDFDAARLEAEVLSVPESAWRPHPQGNPGNSALPLIAVGGDASNDSTRGPMAPTPELAGMEYLQQVLASFSTVFGRSRLMRLDGNSEATLHVDVNYYWAERVRIHVPIVTDDSIEFQCGDAALHMAPGESWIFDAWRRHNVLNPSGTRRIHLVADTVGTAQFWDLVARGQEPFGGGGAAGAFESSLVPHRPGAAVNLELEQRNFPVVMTPWELTHLVDDVALAGVSAAEGSEADLAQLRALTRALLRQWRALWARGGDTADFRPAYEALLGRFADEMTTLRGKLVLPNGQDPVGVLHHLVVQAALNEDLRPPNGVAAAPPVPTTTPTPAPTPRQPASTGVRRPGRRRFERPVFIVAPPRSGTSLLFETLSLSPSVWTIGGESHGVIEGIGPLHPSQRGWDSNRLGRSDARPPVPATLDDRFFAMLRDRHGNAPDPDATGLRLLEKTPKNSLRVPFLDAVYPDATFVYIHRDPAESLSSMIAAWESGRFVTYPDLPGWDGKPWSLVLPPEWRKLAGADLAEIVAHQWQMTSEILLADLERLPSHRWAVVGYHNLVADPRGEVERLCGFLDLEWDAELDDQLPLSRHTLTPPRPEKWRQHADELDRVLPDLKGTADRGRAHLGRPLTLTARVESTDPVDPTSPYRSTVSGNLAGILRELGSTLVASTYQTGKLVAVRELDGGVNTHFRSFESPMGIAHQGNQLAIGTRSQIWEYQDMPEVIGRLSPPGRHDACYLPRFASYTGDIRVHDVAYAGGELWAVATRFSCLVTLDGEHSFVPRWRPPFITALAAEDRCHLNGMAVVDDEIRYVTALGVSDEAGGWRDHKADGGVILDVPSGEVVASGLSMPHSPRWHDGRLWVLESGKGSLATVDPATGAVQTVTELPGFTRGLAFAGPLAFVGLSEVREANIFGGLPLTARLEDRQCGVWVVDTRSGQTVASLQFDDLVQEIFDVVLLPGTRFPEIAERDSQLAETAYLVPPETT